MTLEQPNYDSDEALGILPTHRWLGKPQKSHYIPAWYRPHKDLDVPILHRGEDQQMKIRNVLPWRRWALDADGNTIAQSDFEAGYLRYMNGFTLPETHSVQAEYIPNVLPFVREKLDPNGNAVDFAYHDDHKIVKTEKFTEEGEVAKEFIAKEQKASENAAALRILMRLKQSGKLTAEQFAEEAERLFGEHDATILSVAPALAAPKPQPAEQPAEQTAEQKPKRPLSPKQQAHLERLRQTARAKYLAAAKTPDLSQSEGA